MPITPDAEAIVIQRLLDAPDVAALVDDRVYPAIPPEAVFPLVTVAQASDETEGWGTVAASVLDVQAWGLVPMPQDTGKAQVSLILRTVRAALWDRTWIGEQTVGGIVSGVSERVGLQWLPDPETNRARYVFQIVLHAHPSPS